MECYTRTRNLPDPTNTTSFCWIFFTFDTQDTQAYIFSFYTSVVLSRGDFGIIIISKFLYQVSYQNFTIPKFIIITVLKFLVYQKIGLVRYGNGTLSKHSPYILSYF